MKRPEFANPYNQVVNNSIFHEGAEAMWAKVEENFAALAKERGYVEVPEPSELTELLWRHWPVYHGTPFARECDQMAPILRAALLREEK